MKLQWKYYVMKKALTIENRDYYCNPMITFKPENYAKKQNLKINHLKITDLVTDLTKDLVTEPEVFRQWA